MSLEFYVYLIFRSNGSPCYVGKGKGNRVVHSVRRSTNPHLRAISKAANGSLPYLKIRENLSETEALEVEKVFIRAIGRTINGGPLVNMTDGGEGTTGRPCGLETKKKLSDSARGRPKTEETRRRISLGGRGLKRSAETRERIRQANIGKVISEEARKAMRNAAAGRIPCIEAREATKLLRTGLKESDLTRERKRASMLAHFSRKRAS